MLVGVLSGLSGLFASTWRAPQFQQYPGCHGLFALGQPCARARALRVTLRLFRPDLARKTSSPVATVFFCVLHLFFVVTCTRLFGSLRAGRSTPGAWHLAERYEEQAAAFPFLSLPLLPLDREEEGSFPTMDVRTLTRSHPHLQYILLHSARDPCCPSSRPSSCPNCCGTVAPLH